jgi:hypothetical protein
VDRPAQLHERLGRLTDLEPDAQRLGLERGCDGQDDVGQVRRRALSPWDITRFEPKLTSARARPSRAAA